MSPKPLLAASIALAVAAPPLAAAASESFQIQPGQWRIHSETKNSMMPEPRVDTRTECVTDTEWDVEELMRDARGCTIRDVESSADRLRWKVECSGPGGRMNGRADYRSEGDRVDGQMNMAMQTGQMNVTMDMKFQAQRLGDCE